MEHQSRFEAAIRASDAGQALRTLATDLSCEGYSRQAIYDLFEAFMLRLRDAGRAPEEEVVMDIMDGLMGWCHPDARIFPER